MDLTHGFGSVTLLLWRPRYLCAMVKLRARLWAGPMKATPSRTNIFPPRAAIQLMVGHDRYLADLRHPARDFCTTRPQLDFAATLYSRN
jgi:hypothetical protein